MRILAALLFASTVVFAQSANEKNCSIEGSVVNSVTGAPIPRARVALSSGDSDTSAVYTDAAGNWSFPHLACGAVAVSVSRIGFLPMKQTSGGSQMRPLSADAPVTNLRLSVSPQAVIAGRVLNDEGDPLQGARVSLMASRVVSGLRNLQAATFTVTNDLGEYRFAALTAGKYVLCANAGIDGLTGADGVKVYGEECYPGPMEEGAAVALDLRSGAEERADFALPRLSAVQIRGAVSGGPERAPIIVQLYHNTGRTLATGLSASAGLDGAFVLRNVPSGSYTLIAVTTQDYSARRFTARASLEVGSHDVEGVQLQLASGVNVNGSIKVLSATGIRIDKEKYTLDLKPADEPYTPGAKLDENDTAFTFEDVMPGRYWLGFRALAPFYLKGITMGGRNIADSEFTVGSGSGNIEIVVSDDGGTVEGDVSGDDGPAATWVFLERDGAPSINLRANANGHFRVDNVPPGDYKVYAWDDMTDVEYANPEWMRLHAKGIAVTVQPGQTIQTKLTRQVAPDE